MEVNKSFIKKYGNLIRDTIWKTGVRDKDEYDNIYADVLIRIIKHDNYDKEKAAESTWIVMVTRSVLGNHFKKKSRDIMRLADSRDISSILASKDPPDKDELVYLFKRIIHDPIDRVILIAHYHEGLSYVAVV